MLGGGEWTGAASLVIDPRDPDVLYAATWQHHRTVAAYMGGRAGVPRSTAPPTAGDTWEELTEGLPEGNMAKIGLAISPQNPDVLYAAIELNRAKGGVYRSTDRGASWEKRSDAVSGATGPHYYQELYASPHAFDRIYLVDVRMQISDDGGQTFRRMNESDKHSDNHSLAFRADDPDYLLVGTDGGIYESFDLAKTWRFMANLPVTQFYKVAVDDAEPFYTIYGGTQDNSTQGGPSRTDAVNGIRNADWVITLGGDGHQPATEPGNPDIIYSESQQGHINRVDRTTGETVYIQPQPEPGDPPERFNWDAPILVSPHSPTRIYYASQRVWRSDDRGDSWRAGVRGPHPGRGPHAPPAHGAPVELGLAVGHERHVQLQHHHLPGRVAAAGGPPLRRHRRRDRPGARETGARPGGRSRWARCPGSPPPPSSTTSRPTSTTRTPCTWPSTTTSTGTSRPT